MKKRHRLILMASFFMSAFGSYASAVNIDAFQPNMVESSQCVLREPDTFPENVFVKLPKLLEHFQLKLTCVNQSEDGNTLGVNVAFANERESATLRFEKYSEPRVNDYYAAVPATTRFYITTPDVDLTKFQGIVFEKDNTRWVKVAVIVDNSLDVSYPEGAIVEIAFPFSMKDRSEFETSVSFNAKNIKDADISAAEMGMSTLFRINNSKNEIADVWDLINARDFQVKFDLYAKGYQWGARGLSQFSTDSLNMTTNITYKNQFIPKDLSTLITFKNYVVPANKGIETLRMDANMGFNVALDPVLGYQLNMIVDTTNVSLGDRPLGAIKLYDVTLSQLDAASIDAIVTAANRALVVQLRSQMSGPNAPSVAAVKESAHQLTQSLEENIPKIFSKPTVLRLNSSWHSVNDILLYDLKAIFAFQPLSAYIREKPNLLDMVRNRPIDSINKLIKSVYFNFKIDDKNIVSELSSEKEMNQYEAQNVKQLNAVIVILKMLGIIQPDAGKIGVDLRFENNQLVLNGKVIDLERLMSLLESANHYLSK